MAPLAIQDHLNLGIRPYLNGTLTGNIVIDTDSSAVDEFL
jgi:hypothetical protein